MTLTDAFTLAQDTADNVVEVVLFDEDPVSRHVLGAALAGVGGITVVDSTDDAASYGRRRPAAGHVAVISASHDRAVELVRLFTGLHLRAVCLGVGWTQDRLDEMFHARASGCLVKETRVARLAAAVRAVASGCVVLSDELRCLQVRTTAMTGPPPATASPSAGYTSAEVLVDGLTDREFEVLALLAQGWSTAETAKRLIVSRSTVKSHVSHALTKLGVRNRVEAVLLVRGLLDRRTGSSPLSRPGAPRALPAPSHPTSG
ncbi:response regulator transcription factor [Umezawaea tangerina]|uniref:DNA-binding NarL/FixJ family response regulator n=1 Tax=Umezawaea tangerina TaxID=84725 RepID=A0A2T0SU23_9PSEU|nr:response regulator transcription factor [Umezawaea tangerina]PRY36915.1 DNA-binding NarL/FixJ family response regulator [Umezawaea tangerina]